MLFRRKFYPGLVEGTITLTFRRWTGPRIRVGGRYRLDSKGVVVVDSVDQVNLEIVTEDEALLSGYPDLACLLEELNRGVERPLADDSTVYRVSFHYVREPDPREQLARDAEITREEVDRPSERLRRMDSPSRHGPWTQETLTSCSCVGAREAGWARNEVIQGGRSEVEEPGPDVEPQGWVRAIPARPGLPRPLQTILREQRSSGLLTPETSGLS